MLGHYNPRTKPERLEIDRERLAHWLKAGAQPSDTVRTLVDRLPPVGGRRGGRRVVSRARNVVEVVARALATRPEDVHVTEVDRRGTTVVELTMAPGELGRVIGRQGRTAAAVRTLAAAAGDMDGRRVSVDFRDDE